MQPRQADSYRLPLIGDGPQELEHKRWVWLQTQAFPLLARALDDIVTRLERIEQKLDLLEAAPPAPEPPRRRRRSVAEQTENVEQ